MVGSFIRNMEGGRKGKNYNYKTKILNEESVRVYEASVAFLTTFLLFISLSQSWFPGNSNHHQPLLKTQGNLSRNQPECFIEMGLHCKVEQMF